MAMVITFAEPLTSLVFRRIIRELEPTTFAKGLTNRQPMQMLSVNLNPTAPQVQQTVANGMQFQKLSVVRVNEDAVANKAVEELIVDPNQIVYRNMNYSRWDNISGLYWDMNAEAITSVLDNVPIRAIRLEYLDRFLFDGDPDQASAKGVIKQGSEVVTPHIFHLNDLWHSHTGKLEKTDGENRRLFQVNIDMIDMVGPDSIPKRSIALVSAVEDRFAGGGLEGGTVSSLRATFDDLHKQVKELFKSVVDDGMLAAVGLEND
ncbi:hypothetical protein FJ970_22550 [Mesorhizobium sp. B2-1-8]|uniref:hypothetical protein n=1 Tax=Mesorhizobium sp. B2-1-8 TaxID=2589967 RepID=UPI0015E31AB9|nr:hypothetical protein [Mesorhizobium sp. B2-1-8]UCI17865.1 hypothetical protein FJ970_22550 [Mesorhizobium sp. B2-1-8]